jgi:hypothetical protein
LIRYVCIAVEHIDAFGILAVFHTRKCFCGWLAIPARAFERAFIVLYLGFTIASILSNHMSPWWMLVFLLVAAGMWRDYKSSDRVRFLRLLSIHLTFLRAFLLSLALWVFLISVMAPPYGLRYLWGPMAQLVYSTFQFAVCLPKDDDGERGKRAKLAAEKLKELFGTGWQSDPVARPV